MPWRVIVIRSPFATRSSRADKWAFASKAATVCTPTNLNQFTISPRTCIQHQWGRMPSCARLPTALFGLAKTPGGPVGNPGWQPAPLLIAAAARACSGDQAEKALAVLDVQIPGNSPVYRARPVNTWFGEAERNQ